MPIFRQVIVFVVLAVMGIGLWLLKDAEFLREVGVAAPPPAGLAGSKEGVPVVAEPVVLRRDDIVVEAVGTGQARRAVTIYPAVAGEVVEVSFEAGDRVANGAALLRLDREEEELAVRLARVDLDDARQTLARYEKTAPTGAVSANEVDLARTAVERAKLQLAQAEVALRDRTVRAPFDGVVGIARVDPGDRVTPETMLTTIDDRSVLLVDFEVPETYAGRVGIGHPIRARTWTFSDIDFTGELSALGSRVDPVTRTLQVRARIPNDDDRLRPGMSFAVFLDLAGRAYPSVPEISVLWGRDGAYVWRVGSGVAERVGVSIRKRGEGRVLIEGALEAGELIAVEGVQRLRAGREVTFVAADEPAGQDVGEAAPKPDGGKG